MVRPDAPCSWCGLWIEFGDDGVARCANCRCMVEDDEPSRPFEHEEEEDV